MKKIIYLLSICIITSSCGFEPMYGSKLQNSKQENVKLRSQLSNISISNIPNAEGQYLRNALIDSFYINERPTNPRYTLNISKIIENTVNLDVTKSANATRAQLRLITNMKLIDNQSGKDVLSRKLSTIAGYNILTSEFATRVSKRNMRENSLNDLARQIELQIGLYLQRQ